MVYSCRWVISKLHIEQISNGKLNQNYYVYEYNFVYKVLYAEL